MYEILKTRAQRYKDNCFKNRLFDKVVQMPEAVETAYVFLKEEIKENQLLTQDEHDAKLQELEEAYEKLLAEVS